jgi:hypothetical protein
LCGHGRHGARRWDHWVLDWAVCNMAGILVGEWLLR